jgi:hypothetical protein
MICRAGAIEVASSSDKADQVPGRGRLAAQCRAAAPGLLLAAVAVLTLLGTSGLPLGNARHLGPAAMPDMLAALLLVLGIVIAIERTLARRIGGDQ